MSPRWRFWPEKRAFEGATSHVWRAVDHETGERVALKVGKADAHRARLADEAERLASVGSPTMATVLGAGRVPHGVEGLRAGAPYVAMQWVDGEPLDRFDAPSGAEREEAAWVIARDVGAALRDLGDAATAHGDVKPANVVLLRKRARIEACLVDLGLGGDAAAASPTGGTRRYLAPEVFAGRDTSDGRCRDLWALGLTLAETLDPDIATAAAARGAKLPEPIGLIVRALLSESPGARPSAAWVAETAARRIGRGRRSITEERAKRIRHAYLALRRRAILRAARCGSSSVSLKGEPGEWLTDALSLATQVARLRGDSLDREAPPLGDLDDLGRSRWLVSLVGPPAAAWPSLPVANDADLAHRLLEASERVDPAGLSYADLADRALREPIASHASTPIEVAMALGEGAPPAPLLTHAEQLVEEGAPEALRIALGRALRLRGESGRAIAILSASNAPEARVEAAEAARRAGDRDRAAELLDTGDVADDPMVRSRAKAVQARLLLDAGDPQGAKRLIGEHTESPAALEVVALCHLAEGERDEATAAIDRARPLVRREEDRARFDAAEANLAHSAGRSERALELFRSAAEHAARAGAALEEATYLTGVAAAAADVGDLGEALRAARRATLLFHHLGRPAEAARAALNRASVLATAGALNEARDAAEDAITRARGARDRRCEAYVHLALADVGDDDALEHATRASTLLADADRDDALRVGARLLSAGGDVDLATLDQHGRSAEAAADARLDWWGARAQAAAAGRVDARADSVLAELSALANAPAPVASRGPAMTAGAHLAARQGDGDTARRLALAGSEAARQLLRRCPDELRVAVAGLAWVNEARSPREATVSGEQVADIETLVRALAGRDRLKPLLDRILDALVLWTGVERGLLLLKAPRGRLVPRAARNLARTDLTGEQLKLSRSLADRALAAGEPVVAVDAAGELPEVHASVHALRLRSVLAVPLIARGESLGVVYLDDRERRGAFGPRELSWVRLVATLAAVAISDAKDRLMLRRAVRRAERAESRTSRALARSEAELDVAERELARTQGDRETRYAYDGIVGESDAVRKMLKVVDRVTPSDIPVLLTGESGSGKELVARAIHDNGPRKTHKFVAENCSAIPEGLLESTLFGHVRGAFTGASRQRAGLFEIAHRGTLFLDEIAEMSLGMQTKLLRVLENGELHPVGAERPRKVDVRVIGATHKDLAKLVEQGEFREDLLYRLNVISIQVPPLRERPGDVKLLAKHFLTRHAAGRSVRLSKAALSALAAYPWPGNVRQLENEIRRALVLADGRIEPEHLSQEVLDRTGSEAQRPDGLNVRQRVDALEVELVRAALERTGGNQTRAAQLLGVSRFGLQKMMKRLKIGVPTAKGGRARAQRVADRQ